MLENTRALSTSSFTSNFGHQGADIVISLRRDSITVRWQRALNVKMTLLRMIERDDGWALVQVQVKKPQEEARNPGQNGD